MYTLLIHPESMPQEAFSRKLMAFIQDMQTAGCYARLEEPTASASSVEVRNRLVSEIEADLAQDSPSHDMALTSVEDTTGGELVEQDVPSDYVPYGIDPDA